MSSHFVRFRADSSNLSPSAMHALARFAVRLKAERRLGARIEAVGYADATGTSTRNLQLGEQRATVVLHYLHLRGAPLGRMSAVSYGGAMPNVSNATAAGRAANRRVVVLVLE